MLPGTIVLIVLGALLAVVGIVMALRSGRSVWWVTIVFGVLLLVAAMLGTVLPHL